MAESHTHSKTVAVIIIKAHSVRVPGKNFRSLGGKPLYHWIVEAALALPQIDQLVIDTDARDELTRLGLPDDERLVLRNRPEALLGNHVTANALLDAIIPAYPADTYLMTHATSPFLTPATLRRGIAAYHAAVAAGRADSLMSVTRVQTRFYRKNGSPVNHDPNQLIPTQDLEPWFEENSGLYVFSADSFHSTGSRVGRTPLMFPIPALEAVDIDTLQDWELAETIARGLATSPH